MAEATHENIKEKVQAVREVVPGKSNNEVVLVLQYYDYNVERAIQAYLEDGAKEALQEWNFAGTKQPNKKRKNKKKGGADKAGDKQGTAPPAASANDKGEIAVNGKAGLPNGDLTHSVDQSDADSPLDSPTSHPGLSIQDVAKAATSSPSSSSSTATAAATASQPLPQRHPQNRRGHGDSHSAHDQQHHHHHHQQHAHARERTVSERSASSAMGDGHHRKPHQGLEKAIKDLHRQTTSLERLRHLLDHEIDRSYKSMKSVFEELRQGLSSREAQLMAEMDVLRTEASQMLEMRQGKAADLKRQVERADRLKESEVSDLRAEIKHFVSERRHDDDLGRTTRFLYDSDHMLDEMKKFGEVVHVKSMYTTRRASVSSVASSSISHDDANHDEDLSPHSQDVSELQDRLKNSLKLQDSPGKDSSSHPSSTQNGSHADNIRSNKNSRGQQQSSTQSAHKDSNRGNHSVSPSLDVNSNKATISSPSSSSGNNNSSGGPASYSNTGSPGRGGRGGSGGGQRGQGRGRGRGGRGGGGGRGRGGQGYGGDRSRPQSSQGEGGYSGPQSGGGSYRSNAGGNRPDSAKV